MVILALRSEIVKTFGRERLTSGTEDGIIKAEK
jgi:hypothetical protein